MKPSSLTLRLVAAAGLWTAAALLAGGLVLSLLFRDYVKDTTDSRLSVLLENLVASTDVTASGRLALIQTPAEPRFSQPYSGWYWQISRKDGPPIRSRSLWDQALKPNLDVPVPTERHFTGVGPDNQLLRMTERDIKLPGSDDTYRFTVGMEQAEIDKDVKSFDQTLFWSLGALGIGLLTAVVLQVRYGLRPLRQVGRSLAAIRSGRARRLEEDFPSEIMPLIKELNSLLDHNAAVVERARTHVGNLAHALKTPLAVLQNESAQAPADLSTKIKSQTDIMRRYVDHYLVRARTAATGTVLGARAPIEPVVDDLLRTLGRIYADRDIRVKLDGERKAVFRGERQDLEEMLGNLLENAFNWARARVVVNVAAESEMVAVSVEDDGPGISSERREAVFGRGKRFDESVPGSGLGLAIVRDMAELCGGSITLDDSPLGGLRATLRLPGAADASATETGL
jgi:signal transduction histidine kinase